MTFGLLTKKQSRWEDVRTSSSVEPLRPVNPPGFRRTGLFFPLQKRTLLKTLKMCLSHRDLDSLLGLERLLLVATLSLLDSRAWRFWRIRELAMAAAIYLRDGRSYQGQNICACSVSQNWELSLFSPTQVTCLNTRIHSFFCSHLALWSSQCLSFTCSGSRNMRKILKFCIS